MFTNNLNIIKKHLLIISNIITIMPKFCSECGSEIKDGGFCPNCGKKVKARVPKFKEELTYGQLIKEIVFIEENGQYRLSKAKLIGVALFLYCTLGIMMPGLSSMVSNPRFFIFVFSICFIVGLFWYCVCRIIGYLVRTYILK